MKSDLEALLGQQDFFIMFLTLI